MVTISVNENASTIWSRECIRIPGGTTVRSLARTYARFPLGIQSIIIFLLRVRCTLGLVCQSTKHAKNLSFKISQSHIVPFRVSRHRVMCVRALRSAFKVSISF